MITSDQTVERTIRVLLVDDQELVRSGFRSILESEEGIEVVGEADTGAAALEEAWKCRPNVVCMDVQMPDMDGLEATRLLVSDEHVEASILILTTFKRNDYLFEAIRVGASGFLLKNTSAEELIKAVQVVARGDALLDAEVTRSVLQRLATPSNRPPRPAPEPREMAELTAREREVLTLLAQGLSNAEIAGLLFLGEATVKSHVSKVLMKLALRDRIQAVVYAYEHGLVVPGGTDGTPAPN